MQGIASFEKLTFGDLVSFHVDDHEGDCGYVGFFSSKDGIEHEKNMVSQLKIVPKSTEANLPEDKKSTEANFPEDFQTRCVFKILDDNGGCPNEAVVYGTMVKLEHYRTGYLVNVREMQLANETRVLPYLKKIDSDAPVSESLFQILPRYSMRSEGDFVHTQDLVVFRNVQYPDYHLRSQPVAGQEETPIICEKHDGNLPVDMHSIQGWEILRVRRLYDEEEKEEEQEGPAVFKHLYGGDFLTLYHQDLSGKLISRIDDGWERSVGEGNLGLLCRRIQKEDCTACYVRKGKNQGSVLGIWQVLHSPVLKGEVVQWGDHVHLRHVVTGRYLAICCLDVKKDSEDEFQRDVQASSVPLEALPDVAKRRESLEELLDAEEETEKKEVKTEKKLGVGTADHPNFMHTAFEFVPVKEKEVGPVNFEAAFILRHAATRVHFRVIRGEESENDENDVRRTSVQSNKSLKMDMDDLYENGYGLDQKLQPTFSTFQKEVYKLKEVPLHITHDLIYLMRFRPVLWRVAHQLQELDLADLLPSSEIASFINALLAIRGFVLGELEPKSVYKVVKKARGFGMAFESKNRVHRPSSKPNVGSKNAGSISKKKALAELQSPLTQFRQSVRELEHLMAQDKKISIQTTDIKKDEPIVHRQDMVRELNLLEPLLLILVRCFVRYRIEVEEESMENTSQTGSLAAHERDKDMDQLCQTAYTCLEAIIMENQQNAKRLISLGGLSYMMLHLPLGWSPPIKGLVRAMLTDATDNNMCQLFSISSLFSQAQMNQLCFQLYHARASEDWVVCCSILELLSMLCVFDGNVYESMQHFLLTQLFKVDPNSGDIFSMLFNVRTYSTDEPAWKIAHRRLASNQPKEKKKRGIGLLGRQKSNEDDANISELPRKIEKYEISIDLIFDEPTFEPTEEEVEVFLQNERDFLETIYEVYDEDGSGGIDHNELTHLMEDLGIINSYIEDHIDDLGEEASFEELLSWWQSHRQIFDVQGHFFLKHRKTKEDNEKQKVSDQDGVTEAKESKEIEDINQPEISQNKEEEAEAEKQKLLAEKEEPEKASFWSRMFSRSSKSKTPTNTVSPEDLESKEVEEEKDEIKGNEDINTPEEQKDITAPEEIASRIGNERHGARPRHSISLTDIENPRKWTDACSLLSSRSAEMDTGILQWMTYSVELILSLINGRNLESQKIVSAVLPVDLLLDVLSSEMTYRTYKQQYCQILQALYVENDFVFSLRPLYIGQAAALPATLSPIKVGEDGAVFNGLAQGYGENIRSSQAQRVVLRNLIMETMPVLFVNVSNESLGPNQLSFTNSFLALIRSLVKVGFFYQDQEVAGAEAHRVLANLLVEKLDEGKFEAGKWDYKSMHPSFLEEHYMSKFSNIYSIEAKRKIIELLHMIQQILVIDVIQKDFASTWKSKINESNIDGVDDPSSNYHMVHDHDIIDYLNGIMEKIVASNLVTNVNDLLGPLNMCLLHGNQNLTFRTCDLLHRFFFPMPMVERLIETTSMVTDTGLAATVHAVYIWNDLLKKYWRYFSAHHVPEAQYALGTICRAIKILPKRFYSNENTVWSFVSQELKLYPLGFTEERQWKGHELALILNAVFEIQTYEETENVIKLSKSFRDVLDSSQQKKSKRQQANSQSFLVDAPLKDHQRILQRGLSEMMANFLKKEMDASENFKTGSPIQMDIIDSIFSGLWSIIQGNKEHALAISEPTFKMILTASRKFPSAALLLEELLFYNCDLRTLVTAEDLNFFVQQVMICFPRDFDFRPIWALKGIFAASYHALEKVQKQDIKRSGSIMSFRIEDLDSFTFDGLSALLKEFHNVIFEKKMVAQILKMDANLKREAAIYRRDALKALTYYLRLEGAITRLADETEKKKNAECAPDTSTNAEAEESKAPLSTNKSKRSLHKMFRDHVSFDILHDLLRSPDISFHEKQILFSIYGAQIDVDWEEHEVVHTKTLRLMQKDLSILLDERHRNKKVESWILEAKTYIKSGALPFLECIVSNVHMEKKKEAGLLQNLQSVAKNMKKKGMQKFESSKNSAWLNPMAEPEDAENMDFSDVFVSLVTTLSQAICWIELIQHSIVAEKEFQDRIVALLSRSLEIDPSVTHWQREAITKLEQLRSEEESREREAVALIWSAANWRKKIHEFQTEMKLAPSIRSQVLAFYRNAFTEYIRYTADFTIHFKREDFNNWTWGGSRFLEKLLNVIPAFASCNPFLADFFLKIFTDIVQEKIDSLRHYDSGESTKEKEQTVRKFQTKMAELGALTSFQLIFTDAEKHFDKQKVFLLTSATDFATALLLQGNPQNQNDVAQGLQRRGFENSTVDMELRFDFLSGLQFLVGKLKRRIEHQRVTHGKSPTEDWMLLLSRRLLDFFTALSFGENAEMKNFLRRQPGRDSINIVMEVSQFVASVASLLDTFIEYIDDPCFKQVAPDIPGSNGQKRDFVAWHLASSDFAFISILINVLKSGFRALAEFVAGPIPENQIICRRAVVLGRFILQYVGALHLRLRMKNSEEIWRGDDPYLFYHLLNSQLTSQKDLFYQDREIMDFYRRISPDEDVLPKQKTRGLSFKKSLPVDTLAKANDVLNINIKDFVSLATHCEKELLTLLLGLVDGQDPNCFEYLVHAWPMILQNMDNTLLTSRTITDKEGIHDGLVSGYLTLLNWIETRFSEHPEGVTLRVHLEGWKADIRNKIGMPLRDIISSVEVNTKNDTLIQVYFPVPRMVQKHWLLPEIVQVKKHLLYTVSRESPEERVQDFYLKRHQVMDALKMQAVISSKLGPLHVFFGGSGPKWVSYFPSQRSLLLAQTLFQNIFLLYELYQNDFDILVSDTSILNTIKSWEYVYEFWIVLGITHSLNCLSLLASAMLNSSAICRTEYSVKTKNKVIQRLVRRKDVLKFVRFMGALTEAKWQATVLLFSLLGLLKSHIWYALCVTDVVFQIRMMSFLLESVTRNFSKLFLTILLSLIVLYMFSFVAYLMFQDEYSLADKYDCQTLLNCFMLHTGYGLLEYPNWDSDGMILPIYADQGYGQETKLLVQVLYVAAATLVQLSYIIVVNLVLSAIISGLIIDTFSEMRSENEAIESDIVGGCFICGIARDDFERVGESFSSHITHQHNMWKYLQLELYLEQKDRGAYSGQDIYLAQMYSTVENFVTLMPLKKAMVLQAQKLKEKNDLSTVIAKIQKIYMKCESLVKDQQESLGGLDLLQSAHKDRKRESKDHKADINRLQKNQEVFQKKLCDTDVVIGQMFQRQEEMFNLIQMEKEARIKWQEEERKRREKEEEEKKKGFFS